MSVGCVKIQQMTISLLMMQVHLNILKKPYQLQTAKHLQLKKRSPSLRQKPLKSFRVKKMIFPMTW